jgi:hypothetical protein
MWWMMDRRGFIGLAGIGAIDRFIFPRKTEGGQKGLSHEEMAEVISHHPHNVCLNGDVYFGKIRHYHYANEYDPFGFGGHSEDGVEEWRESCDLVPCNYKFNDDGREKSVVGCSVKVCCYDFRHNRYRLTYEQLFDISDSRLKIVRCMGDPDQGIPFRHFARLGDRWIEL